jgi:signal peptidase
MAPAYPQGSLALVEPIDPAHVEPGMTIVFADPEGRGRLIAHRALAQLPTDPPAWRTKGDANLAPDPIPVQAKDVHGRVRWAVPLVGYVVTALRGPQAVVLLVGLPLAVLIASEIRARRRRAKSEMAALEGP